MINLLPPEHKNNIRYGRTNLLLIRWLAIGLTAVGILVLLMGAGWVYINQQSKNLQTDIANTNQQLKTQNLAQVKKDATEISGDVNVINQVLGREIDFSALIQKIGTTMPPGAVLNNLTLSKTSGAVDITASAVDENSISQVAANLTDPKNNLFSQADVINVVHNQNGDFTYQATLKALFANNVQKQFQNVPGAK